MTRPAADPLRALSPDALGRAVAVAVAECARTLGDEGARAEVAARALCRYAQTGARGLDEGGDRTGPWPVSLDLAAWLAVAEALGVAMPDGAPLALAAARARLAVDGGHAVTLEGLGALAGVSLRTVRADLASGRLVATESSRGREREVTAMQARRWLAARGVPGYVEG